MRKIGIVGGVGWPSTADYYRLICMRANAHFKAQGAAPPYPTPPMVIESLVMHETRKLRASPGGGEAAWARFDAVFRDAFHRLAAAGADFGIIASNTPHTRLAAIRRGLDLPIVSILDETAWVAHGLRARSALVLGTGVTMRADDYPAALQACGVAALPRLAEAEIDALQQIIDTEFYQGGSDIGRAAIVDLCSRHVADAATTAVLLACTELPLAFPEHGDDVSFQADGYTFQTV